MHYKPPRPSAQRARDAASPRPLALHVAAALQRTVQPAFRPHGPGVAQGKVLAPPPPSRVVQRYSEEIKDSGTWRLSEDGKMAVLQGAGFRGTQELFLDASVQRAGAVVDLTLTKSDHFPGLYRCRLKLDQLDNDCGSAALKLMRTMAGFNRKTTTRVSTVDATGEAHATSDPHTLRETLLLDEKIASISNDNAFPKVGEAYLIITSAAEKMNNPSLFNFHWGAVVASSGCEVITAENVTGGKIDTWWFQLYSQWDWSQSFHQHYAKTGQLGKAPLTIVASISQVQQTVQKVIEVIEVIEL